jgi:hypothetical protein
MTISFGINIGNSPLYSMYKQVKIFTYSPDNLFTVYDVEKDEADFMLTYFPQEEKIMVEVKNSQENTELISIIKDVVRIITIK